MVVEGQLKMRHRLDDARLESRNVDVTRDEGWPMKLGSMKLDLISSVAVLGSTTVLWLMDLLIQVEIAKCP